MCVVNSCKKDGVEEKNSEITDKELYELSITTNGFSWFKNEDVLLSKSSGSGHPQPYLRTRYNAIAASKLDKEGKVEMGSIFPEGSLIVKELVDNSSKLVRYAVLYKSAGSSNADAKGWVWGYIDADGTVAISASKKGGSCISCHSQEGNIDYMLMNKYYP